jgi:hypothetical protein
MTNYFRDQIYSSMNLKETDELVEIWEMNDRSTWSELAFDVVQEILRSRLGELPLQGEPMNEYAEQNTNEQATDNDDNENKIDKFIKEGDIVGLVNILENDADSMICLNAAKALAQLGDERGLDYLIGALDIPDADVNFVAKEMLIKLNKPRGNLALASVKSSTLPPTAPGTSEKLNAKYPYLTGYVGFIALYTLASIILGFILPSILNAIIVIVIGFFIFKFVVQNNILPYK